MKVTLYLDDDIAQTYRQEADARNTEFESVLEGRLRAAGELDPRSRYLIVAGRSRERLEEALGGMPVLNVEDLIQKVQKLGRVRFGDHKIELTAAQMEEIAYKATK